MKKIEPIKELPFLTVAGAVSGLQRDMLGAYSYLPPKTSFLKKMLVKLQARLMKFLSFGRPVLVNVRIFFPEGNSAAIVIDGNSFFYCKIVERAKPYPNHLGNVRDFDFSGNVFPVVNVKAGDRAKEGKKK